MEINLTEKISTLKAALKYRGLGLSVIPLLKNGKRPALKSWLPFQKEIASEVEIIEWFSGQDYNVGIVTGEVSNILVVDCDTEEAVLRIIEALVDNPILPIQYTPRGGQHFFFKYQDGFISRRYADGIDIKTDGGYVVAYPSTLEGNGWNWGEGRSIFKIPPPIMVERISIFLRALSGSSRTSVGINEGRASINTSTMFQGGQLDEDLFSVANSLTKGGFLPEQTQKVLEVIAQYANKNRNGRLPYTPQDCANKVRSALQRSDRKEINISQEVRDWISISNGIFEIKDIARELKLYDMNDLKLIWAMLDKMVKEGIVEKSGNRRGVYRIKQDDFEEMDLDAPEEKLIDISWPLEVERLYRTYPGSVAVLAGVMGSGKTTFCLNYVLKNLKAHKVVYLSSELGAVELRDRLALFGYPRDTWKGVSFKKVTVTPEDAMDPDAVNVIDYLEIFDEHWKMGLMIKQINDRLRSGMALVAMQKPYGRDIAYGGQPTLAKPRLYLALDKPYDEDHKVKVIKCHNWRDSSDNPNGKARCFRIIKGSRIDVTSDWERESQEIAWESGIRGRGK